MYYVKKDFSELKRRVCEAKDAGNRVGLLVPGRSENVLDEDVKLVTCGEEGDMESIARDLYACIRRFDEDSNDVVDMIFAHGFPSDGLGAAIMNRILKASSYIIE
jgi:L-threonylcarbamoyladenylate synthase